MKTNISRAFVLAFTIFFVSCASSYRPINPPTVYYDSHDLKDGVKLSYKYDVLREKGNKKYSKKEDTKGIRVIAVKITNYTDSTINVSDLIFTSGSNEIAPMDPIIIKNSIKQIVPSYLPYLLLTFLKLYVTKVEDGVPNTEYYPIGYVLGPGITIGNMALAGSANEEFLRELNNYNILNRDIQKGETVYGIIGFRNSGYMPISLKFRKYE